MVDTFKLLCSFADFEATPISEGEVKEHEKIEKMKGVEALPSGITLNLNIQIVLPTTDDASVYDKIFKALKEHILSRGLGSFSQIILKRKLICDFKKYGSIKLSVGGEEIEV